MKKCILVWQVPVIEGEPYISRIPLEPGLTNPEAMRAKSGQRITEKIAEYKAKDVDMILCTGGMSVDPDDRTPGAIKRSGAQIVTYGAPVLPGAMFLLGYFEDGTPVMGLPGCVMYAKSTIFDIMLPRIAAGIPVKAEDFYVLGHGGLCLGCAECRFPDCSFGKV